MRIMTFNVNGIRAAARKGFFAWLADQAVDIVCLQEIRAQTEQLTAPIFHPEAYYCYYFAAQRKGYSGTAVYTRHKPEQVIEGLGWDPADAEGRYLQIDFAHLSVVCMYLPSGSSGEHRQQQKYLFMDKLWPHLQHLRRQKREVVIVADWNICHRPIDLKDWRANQKNSGFLAEERAWLDRVLDELGYIDAFRVVNPEPEQYTWWSNRGRAWDKNVGWRLDYQLITPGLLSAVQSASIYKEQRFSDHAPCTIEYSYKGF